MLFVCHFALFVSFGVFGELVVDSSSESIQLYSSWCIVDVYSRYSNISSIPVFLYPLTLHVFQKISSPGQAVQGMCSHCNKLSSVMLSLAHCLVERC